MSEAVRTNRLDYRVRYNGIILGNSQPKRSERFLKNVLWNWIGVAVTIASGIFLSPYLIRKLGDEGFGVWVLVFGLVENYWIFDLGMRSATVKYSAHYRTTGEMERINELINTGVATFSLVGAALFLVSVALARNVDRVFQVAPAYREQFAFLVMMVGSSWAFGLAFNVFTACLEGFQRFDLSSRIWIFTITARVTGAALLLYFGYGLVALGILFVCCQLSGYALSLLTLRRIFPTLRFSPALVSRGMLRQMARYGVHTMTGGIATQLLNQAAPLMIGHFRPASFVGYYSMPVKLLQYTGDAVDRVTQVTASNTAELAARGDTGAISRLGIYVNRYCLTLFLPLSLFLWFYGRDLIREWIRKPDFVAMSAPVLPVLLISATIAIAGQVNSSSILYGLAQHRGYARALLLEGVTLAAALYLVVPRFGILGAAWTVAILAVLDRGLLTPWLLCRHLRFPYTRYMSAIYLRPALTALPVAALGWWLKSALIPGRTFLEVVSAAALMGSVYYGLAFFTSIDREHRPLLVGWLRRRRAVLARAA